MSKDPAFLFYPGDWLGGTLGMTFEEKGAYLELLMLQFNRGHMTSHMIGQVVGQLWVKLEDKFVKDENGLWYNVRLEQEQKNRKAFVESRKNNINGKNQHTKKVGHMEGHVTSHMENENENIDINNNSVKKNQFLSNSNSLVFYDMKQVESEMINSESWHEDILRLNPSLTKTRLLREISTFCLEQKASANESKCFADYKRHFVKWIALMLRNENKGVKPAAPSRPANVQAYIDQLAKEK